MDILPQLLVNALITGSIYALASAGLALTYGLLKILNFAHGQMMMVGAYIFYLFLVLLEVPFLQATLLTMCCSIVLALGTLTIFVLPFSRLSFVLTFVTTLALSNMLEAVISMFFGVNVKSLTAGFAATSMEFYGVYITPLQLIILASAFFLLFGLAYLIHITSIGRRVRAISEDSYAAESLGISKRKTSFLVYTLGVMLAVFAGVMVAYETNIQPTMGGAYTIKAFAAMVLGGLGNLWGTVCGSYLLGLIENLSIGLDFGGYSLPAGYKDAFAFGIILLVLLFKPEGLFSKRRRIA